MELIANLEKQHSDLSTHIEESRNNLGSLHKELRELRAEREEAQNAVARLDNQLTLKQQEQKATQNDIAKSEHILGELNSKLKEAKRDAAIAELFDKQQPFWDALQQRIEFHISELDSGFEGIDEPKDAAEVIAYMRRIDDPSNREFSERTTEIRQAQTHFAQAVKNVCALAVDGKRATPEHKRQRLDILDRFLASERIAPLWC